MILVDTSVWINHLRAGHPALHRLLLNGAVACHEFVIGELACGSLRKRDEILDLLARLPAAPTARHEEALALVESRRLIGLGLGWIDVHILASALLGRAQLWTADRSLSAAASALGLGWEPASSDA